MAIVNVCSCLLFPVFFSREGFTTRVWNLWFSSFLPRLPLNIFTIYPFFISVTKISVEGYKIATADSTVLESRNMYYIISSCHLSPRLFLTLELLFRNLPWWQLTWPFYLECDVITRFTALQDERSNWNYLEFANTISEVNVEQTVKHKNKKEMADGNFQTTVCVSSPAKTHASSWKKIY